MQLSSWSLPVRNWKWWYIPLTLILFMMITTLPQIIGTTILGIFGHPDPMGYVLDHGRYFELLKFSLMVFLPIIFLWIIAWRTPTRADFGLGDTDTKKTIIATLTGFLFFIILTYIFERYSGNKDTGLEVAKSLGMGITLTNDILVILMITIFAPIGEEFLFRGLILRATRDGLSNIRWMKKVPQIVIIVLAVALSSYLFSSSHGGDGQDFWMLGILGATCAFAYLWSGSLIAPIMIHAINNVLALFQAITTDGFPIIDRGVTFGLLFVSPIITLVLIYGIRILLCRELGPKSNS